MRFLLTLFFCSLVRHKKSDTGTTTQQPYVCTQQSNNEQLEAELDAAIYANDEMFLTVLAAQHQPFTPYEMNAISLLADRYQSRDFQP